MPTEEDATPILIKALLFIVGTPIAFWMAANSDAMSPWFVITCILFALQLVVGLFFFVLSRV